MSSARRRWDGWRGDHRTWQTAHKMKDPARSPAGRWRAQRQFPGQALQSPSTPSTPALTHGIAHEVGSIAVGKLADIVLWKPPFFGAKPELIVKGGFIVAARWAIQRFHSTPHRFTRGHVRRPGRRTSRHRLTFVSAGGAGGGHRAALRLSKDPVRGSRHAQAEQGGPDSQWRPCPPGLSGSRVLFHRLIWSIVLIQQTGPFSLTLEFHQPGSPLRIPFHRHGNHPGPCTSFWDLAAGTPARRPSKNVLLLHAVRSF